MPSGGKKKQVPLQEGAGRGAPWPRAGLEFYAGAAGRCTWGFSEFFQPANSVPLKPALTGAPGDGDAENKRPPAGEAAASSRAAPDSGVGFRNILII